MKRWVLGLAAMVLVVGVSGDWGWGQATRRSGAASPTSRASDAPGDSPEVSAWSWVVGDGETGTVIGSGEGERPRKAASTTKVMCAWVVMKLAEKDPAVLDERVVFSEGAAAAGGTTCEVKAGESLTVRECLYGLLLPSGNDAGVALGEHFNSRFEPRAAAEGELSQVPTTRPRRYLNFVAEMNREAKRLGMTQTTYRIPFGDGGGPRDTTTTASDLFKLGCAVMKNEGLQKYVGTKEYVGSVRTVDGGTREQKWVNTNRLLGREAIDGLRFDGVKTGETGQARACLVSSARKVVEGRERHLIVVVLGSARSEDRFLDTERLVSWAWGKLSR